MPPPCFRRCLVQVIAAATVIIALVFQFENVPTSPALERGASPRFDDDEDDKGLAARLRQRPYAPNVTLTFRHPRSDRMGSRTQLPLAAWLIARYHGYNFCSPSEAMTKALSFPICAGGEIDYNDPTGNVTGTPHYPYMDDNITRPGIYFIDNDGRRNTLWATLNGREYSGASMITMGAMREWREMILGAHLRPEIDEQEDLWFNKDSIRIVAHVRRGDITPGKRNDVWIDDETVIALIEMARHVVRRNMGPDVKIEVHVFSESYGSTNWNRYGNLVDAFHLAPFGSQDVDLNLRDWKHFVNADVMIVGGTFSYVPSLARPMPQPITTSKGGGQGEGVGILPMTLNWQRGGMPHRRGWVAYRRYRPHQAGTIVVANFPDGTVAAFVDNGAAAARAEAASTWGNRTLDVAAMLNGICGACKASSGPAFKCFDRIARYFPQHGPNHTALEQLQRWVADRYPGCASCNPASCRLREDRPGDALSIESVIGNRYEESCPLIHPVCLEGEYHYSSRRR